MTFLWKAGAAACPVIVGALMIAAVVLALLTIVVSVIANELDGLCAGGKE